VDGLTWVVLIGTTLMTLLFSIVHYTLRDPSRVRLERVFAGRRSGRLKYLDEHLDEMLLATALVRAISYLLLTLLVLRAFGGPADWAGQLGALAAAGGLVALFGVGLPHAWARYAGERTLAMAWPIVLAGQVVLWPITRALRALDMPVRRLSGHHEPGNGRATTEVEQEILQLASEGHAEGQVDADEREMIESVIEFRDIRASEIMTPRTDIEALPVDAARTACREAVARVGHSRIPVYEDTLDKIVGVLYAKDLLVTEADGPFDLRSVMREPMFVPETKVVGDLLDVFRTRKVHMAIVLDEYGGTAGLVTIEDLLEEIVGEIADEYEPAEPEMLRRVNERTFEVDARMYVDDLNDELKIALPEEEDYDTVGGFVFSTLGYIPAAGETFDHGGVRFTILDAEQRKINRLRVEQLTGQAAKSES